MIQKIALSRGAALIAEQAAGTRSFAAGFWFNLGSRHEAPHERGFTHFVEHMVFKGSLRRKASEIAREVDRVGGYLNAFTERDSLCFHIVVPAAKWRLALDVLVDLVFCAIFPPEEFERERGVIVSEILASRDDPEEASHDAFLERIWHGNPLGLKIAGEPEDIAAASHEAVYAFYRTRLLPESLVASVSGPVSVEEVQNELTALLDALPGTSRSSVISSEVHPEDGSPPQFIVIRDCETASANQVYLYEALQLDGPFAPSDYYALTVLNGALGESMSSRLFQSLRERGGLCYSIYSAFSLEKTEGLWISQANASVRSFPKLLAGLDSEIDALAMGGAGSLTEEEVAESVSRIEGAFELALDDTEYRMRRLARQYFYAEEILDDEETRNRIRAVNKDDVDMMAMRLFSGRPRARFAFGHCTKIVREALGLSPITERLTTVSLDAVKKRRNYE